MDADRFDKITKALARGASRRRVLSGLGSGLAGLLARGGEGAAVICHQGGVLCALDAQCCSGSCINFHCTCDGSQVPCGPRCCAASQVCTDATHGQCCTPTTCPPGVCGSLSNGCGGML